MPKAIVMIAVFLYCTYFGFSKGKRLEYRTCMLKVLLDDSRMLSLRLQHERLPLQQLLQECAGAENHLFSVTSAHIGEGRLPKEALALALEEGRKRGDRAILALEAEDFRCLNAFFETLGTLDALAQCRQTDCLAEELELLLEKARERGSNQGKLYRSLGLMAGMACAILLI